MDLSNTSFFTSLSDYLWNTTIDYAFTLGWDPQASAFARNTYTFSFIDFFMGIYRQHYQSFNI